MRQHRLGAQAGQCLALGAECDQRDAHARRRRGLAVGFGVADQKGLRDLAPGAQLELRLPVTVNLHGKTREYNAELLATRLDDRRFQVVTLEPLVINASDFDLAPGLDSLRKVAGLSAISLSVPVGAVLIFTAR